MNIDFWIVFAGTILGVILAAVVLMFLIKLKLRHRVLTFWKKTAPIEAITSLTKLTWRNYFENNLRARTGEPVNRPFGTNIHFYRWDRFQFNPVYFAQKPLSSHVPIHTEVVLGPQAKKPLTLKIPIINGGMSYGSSLSFKAKMALAKASTISGTATNTGSGPFLEEERASAGNYILQLSRGFWSRPEKILRRVDMIEIALGHGSWGPAPVRISGQKVTDGFAECLGTIPGLDVLIESQLPEVDTLADWNKLVARLKELSGGVPIAVKIGGTHNLEQELELLLIDGVDVLVLDGAEGGTHASPAILQDDMGLPTLPSLCRAVKYFEENHLKGKVSLVIGGGLSTPGDFLKCLALGADAVIIGTVACLVMSHTQITKATPWEPPTQVIYYGAKKEAAYDPDQGAKHLANYLASCVEEMRLSACAMGKTSLREMNKNNLVALDPLYAEMAGVTYGGDAHGCSFVPLQFHEP